MKSLSSSNTGQVIEQERDGVRTYSWKAPGDFAIWGSIAGALGLFKKSTLPQYERLPVPVRFRAIGALKGWLKAAQAAGQDGQSLQAAWAHPGAGVAQIFEALEPIVDANPIPNFGNETALDTLSTCLPSMYLMSYFQRQGGLYEPTPALHRMLGETDVADVMPMRFLQPPMPALFIVPDPSMWRKADGFEAVLILDHTQKEGSIQTQPRRFSFVAWVRNADGQSITDMIDLTIEDEDMPVADVLSQATACSRWGASGLKGVQDLDQARWLSILNYAVKMLLYLSLDEAQIKQDQAYSKAPRQFSGLGKRKRELKLTQIEQLYDRYVVGPAVLASQLPTGERGVSASEARTHWRRGHFRLQPHGPQASLRKVIFIMPTMVRVDLLGLV